MRASRTVVIVSGDHGLSMRVAFVKIGTVSSDCFGETPNQHARRER
jgi:hypothetical protein